MRSRKNTQSLLPYLVLNQMLVGSPFIRKNKLSRLTLACRLWLSVFNQRIFPCCTLSPYTVQKLNKGCLFIYSLNQMFLYYYLNQLKTSYFDCRLLRYSILVPTSLCRYADAMSCNISIVYDCILSPIIYLYCFGNADIISVSNSSIF